MAESITSTNLLPPPLLASVDAARYTRFLEKACKDSDLHHAVISFPFVCKDPLQWFHANHKSFSFHYYWEKPADSFAIAALGSALALSATGPNRFGAIENTVKQTQNNLLHLCASPHKDSPRLLGGFSFFDDLKAPDWKGYKSALFTLPEYILTKKKDSCTASVALPLYEDINEDELHQKISRKLDHFSASSDYEPSLFQAPALPGQANGVSRQKSAPWVKLIEQAKQKIAGNEFSKVVLGRQLQLHLPNNFQPAFTLHRLRKNYPRCYTFLMKPPHAGTFIGSTPELLLAVKNGQMQTEALAGSIARGTAKAEDEKLARQLLESFKNNTEHQYVVDHIKNRVAPLVQQHQNLPSPKIRKFANVQHLYTPIRGTLNAGVSALALLGQLHPTPAVGGTPRDEALTYIRQHEAFSRGWFAGPTGWVSAEGEMSFAVGIRSGLINNDTARLFAGCGIVADSDPGQEWQETNLKFRPMLSALHYD